MAMRQRKPRATPRGEARANGRRSQRSVTRNPGHIPLEEHAAEERRARGVRRLEGAVHAAGGVDATRVARVRRPGARRAGLGRTGSGRAGSTRALPPLVTTGAETFDPVDEHGDRLTSPVRRQPDGDECCVAYALAGAMETWLAWVAQSTADLPTLSVDHITTLSGGKKVVSKGAKAVQHGVLEEACFQADPPCPNRASRTWRGTVLQVSDSRPAALCALLRSRRPLVTEIVVFEGFESYDGQGPYIASGAQAGAHALVIVGFERAADGSGVWIVKNSYGEGWGEAGYGRIRWGDPDCNPESVVFMVKEVSRAV